MCSVWHTAGCHQLLQPVVADECQDGIHLALRGCSERRSLAGTFNGPLRVLSENSTAELNNNSPETLAFFEQFLVKRCNRYKKLTFLSRPTFQATFPVDTTVSITHPTPPSLHSFQSHRPYSGPPLPPGFHQLSFDRYREYRLDLLDCFKCNMLFSNPSSVCNYRLGSLVEVSERVIKCREASIHCCWRTLRTKGLCWRRCIGIVALWCGCFMR